MARQPTSLDCGAVCGAGVREGTMLLAWVSPSFQSFPSLPTSRLYPFRCCFLDGCACVSSRVPWALPVDSPVRLGVSPATATPSGFYCQRFWDSSFLCWNSGVYHLSRSPVVSPGLSTQEYGVSQSTNHCLALPVYQPPPCCTSSMPRLPISTPPTSLEECFFFNSLHTIWFSGSSGCFLFLFIYFYREGKGRRIVRETQCVVASCMPPTGILAYNPGMCPKYRISNPLVHRPALSPLSHTSQSLFLFLNCLLSFCCARKWSASTYASILNRSPRWILVVKTLRP